MQTALTSLIAFPAIAVVQGAVVRISTEELKRRTGDRGDFMGVAVALHSCDGPRLAQEIETWEFVRYCFVFRSGKWIVWRSIEFVESLPDCEFVLCIMQDRQHILDHDLWYKNLNTIVQRFWPRIKDYQIGQGINRSK